MGIIKEISFNCNDLFLNDAFKFWSFIIKLPYKLIFKKQIECHEIYFRKLYPNKKIKTCFKLVFPTKKFKESKHFYIPKMIHKCND